MTVLDDITRYLTRTTCDPVTGIESYLIAPKIAELARYQLGRSEKNYQVVLEDLKNATSKALSSPSELKKQYAMNATKFIESKGWGSRWMFSTLTINPDRLMMPTKSGSRGTELWEGKLGYSKEQNQALYVKHLLRFFHERLSKKSGLSRKQWLGIIAEIGVGIDNDNYHVHAVIELPIGYNIVTFRRLIQEIWGKLGNSLTERKDDNLYSVCHYIANAMQETTMLELDLSYRR
jgi:hypothetical protein